MKANILSGLVVLVLALGLAGCQEKAPTYEYKIQRITIPSQDKAIEHLETITKAGTFYAPCGIYKVSEKEWVAFYAIRKRVD